MKREFDAVKSILSVLSYKGIPFPGAWFPWPDTKLPDNGEFNPSELRATGGETMTSKGTVLRRELQGRSFFMPVTFIHTDKEREITTEYEIPNAVIGFTGKKNIVETPMVGRRGTVKELISIDDYEISIAGAAAESDWPEEQLAQLVELFEINEAVSLRCALTDIFMQEDDRVVIKDIEFAEMQGYETMQTVRISAVTDRSFELRIENSQFSIFN